MKGFILRWLINAVALYAAISLVEGLSFRSSEMPDWIALALLALVFGLVNALLRPLLTLDAVTPERVLGAARTKAVHPLACGDAFAVATAVGVVRPARFERATTDSQLEESC